METENIEQTADDLPKEVVDHICKEETKARRKATWEECFERFEEYDQDPQLAEEWDVRKENDLVTVVGKLDSLVGVLAEKTTAQESFQTEQGDESDNGYFFEDQIQDDTPSNISFNQMSDTSSYDGEDENSISWDHPFQQEKQLHHGDSTHQSENTLPVREEEFVEKRSMLQVIESREINTGSCANCGTLVYLPLEYPLCVQCSIQKTGHDECIEENCTTCQIDAEEYKRILKVQACCEKTWRIQRQKKLHNLSSSNSDYSFEESRFHHKGYKRIVESVEPHYEFPIYRENGYETDSSYTYSSFSSSSGEQSVANSNPTKSLRHRCKICKTYMLGTDTRTNYFEKAVPICYVCIDGHATCNKTNCKTCMILMAKASRGVSPNISFKRRGTIYRNLKEMKDTGQSHQYVKLQDPNNSSFIRRFQEQKIDHKKSLNSSRPDFSPMKHRIPHDTSIENYKPEELSNDSMNQCIFSPTKNYKARTKHQFSINKTLRSALSSGSSDLGLSIEKDLNISASKSKRRFTLKTPKKK